MDEARSVRDFWFGKLPPTPQQMQQRMASGPPGAPAPPSPDPNAIEKAVSGNCDLPTS